MLISVLLILVQNNDNIIAILNLEEFTGSSNTRTCGLFMKEEQNAKMETKMHHNVSRFKSLDSRHNLQKSVVKVEANALITTAIAFIAICVYVLVLLLFIFYNFALDFLSLVYVC